MLVIRLGAMGDILHALPAVTALRQAHPGWVIDWVVEPRWRALLAADQPAQSPAALEPGVAQPHASHRNPSTQPVAIHRPAQPESRQGFVSGHDFSRAENAPISAWALSPAVSLTSTPVLNPASPIVDQLHLAATKEWREFPFSRQTLHEIRALRKILKQGDYDTVIDFQGAIRSAIVGRMAGCQRIIGEAYPRERAASWFYTERIKTEGAHVIEQDVELAAAIAGDDLQPTAPWLALDAAAEAWAGAILSADGTPTALINPGAGWGAKRWPAERYAAVARGLMERGVKVLVNTGPGEEALGEQIVKAAAGANLLSCSLEQLIAITRRITLAIAGDTGPLHLACALGRPVVGIYGPTDPRRNGPFGTRFRVLRSPNSRRDHTRHEAPEAGLLTITPEAVLRAADDLLVPNPLAPDSLAPNAPDEENAK